MPYFGYFFLAMLTSACVWSARKNGGQGSDFKPELPKFDFSSLDQTNEYVIRQKEHYAYLQSAKLTPTKEPNILLIVLDTMRGDYVTPEIAPHMHAFKSESIHTTML